MIELLSLIVLAALLAVPLAWLRPGLGGLDLVTGWSALVFTWLAPCSAAWMIGCACLTPPLMALADRLGRRGAFAALWGLILVGGFVAAQLAPAAVWIGVAFFTLRQLHVLGDWWMGKLAVPGLAAHLRYQLFLPAMFIGPVHRIQAFERQCARRRRDPGELAAGAERVLIGAFLAEVIGHSVVGRIHQGVAEAAAPLTGPPGTFAQVWLGSAFDWIALYFSFAGLTGVALGIALMMGIRLEENFNQPWRARDLLDFWSRWHISLTNWARDYAYRPVMALTRSAGAGLVAAMLAIGLWHELSAYYVLWSLWQTAGVVLSRAIAARGGMAILPVAARRIAAPLAILAWLSLARPVILWLLELIA